MEKKVPPGYGLLNHCITMKIIIEARPWCVLTMQAKGGTGLIITVILILLDLTRWVAIKITNFAAWGKRAQTLGFCPPIRPVKVHV